MIEDHGSRRRSNSSINASGKQPRSIRWSSSSPITAAARKRAAPIGTTSPAKPATAGRFSRQRSEDHPRRRNNFPKLRPRLGERVEHTFPQIQTFHRRGRHRRAMHRQLARFASPATTRSSPNSSMSSTSCRPSSPLGIPEPTTRREESYLAKIAEQRPLFWEHEGNRAVRIKNFKLLAAHNEPWQLYDMDHDRTELTDLAPKMPEKKSASFKPHTTNGQSAPASSPGR